MRETKRPKIETEIRDQGDRPAGWSALERNRDRKQFDLGLNRLPYKKRIHGWKAGENLFMLAFALGGLALGYAIFPGFSGTFETSILDGVIIWVMTLACFGGGLVVLIAYLSTFLDTLVIELDGASVTVYERDNTVLLRESLVNYSGISLRQKSIVLANKAGAIDKPYYTADLQHNDPNKTIPLYRGTLKRAQERQEQASRLLRLPTLGGGLDVPKPEEVLADANPLTAAIVKVIHGRKHKAQKDRGQSE